MGIIRRLFCNSPPSQHKFARLVIDGIHQAGEKAQIAYDPAQSRLFVEGETGTRLFLANVYAEYCAVPKSDRDATLKRVIRTWFVGEKTTPEDFNDARHDLLPVIRARGYFDSAALLMQIEGSKSANLAYQPLGLTDDLVVALVYDLPDAMRSVGQKDLDRWGVTFYEAMEVARENLAQLPHSFIGPKEGDGVYLSATNDSYDASRLLLLDIIRQFQVKGDYVAMVPNRDALIVTGSDDVEGLNGMLALAKDSLSKPRPISGLAMRLDGDANADEWMSWMPDAAHPLYQEFRMLQVQSHGQDYSEQKDLLDRLHSKNNEDIFVASFLAAQDDTGQITTHCVWSKNVLALLPRTDWIAFVQEGNRPKMAAWDRVVEVAGDLLTPLDIYPERFRVNGFPNEEQLAAMGAEAV